MSTLLEYIQQGGGEAHFRLIGATLLKNKIKQVYGVSFTQAHSVLATYLRALRGARAGPADRPWRSGHPAVALADADGELVEGLRGSVPGDDLTHGQALGADRVAHFDSGKPLKIAKCCRN